MTSIEEIEKGISYFDRYCKTIGVIIINSKDFDEIGGTFNRKVVWEHNTIFGHKLIVIPSNIYDANFLKEGTAMILERRYFDFLKETLNG